MLSEECEVPRTLITFFEDLTDFIMKFPILFLTFSEIVCLIMCTYLHTFTKEKFDQWTKLKVFTGGILDIAFKNFVNQKILSKAVKKFVLFL